MSEIKKVNNLALNKKGTKVKIIGKPRTYNMLGTFIQYVPTFTYLAFKFDLFTFENQGYALTGWGFITISLVFLAFRQKIKDKLKEYEETFGSATWGRVKSANIAMAIATILFIVYFASYSLFLVAFIYSASSYAALSLYIPYDKLTTKRTDMQKMLDDQKKETDFELLTKQYNQLNA